MFQPVVSTALDVVLEAGFDCSEFVVAELQHWFVTFASHLAVGFLVSWVSHIFPSREVDDASFSWDGLGVSASKVCIVFESGISR
jgi:hypothetical protein